MKLLEPWLKSHDFSHLHYRKKTANNACNPVLDVTPSRDEIERRISAVAAGHRRRPVVVLGIDGAFVPTRPDSARQHRPGR